MSAPYDPEKHKQEECNDGQCENCQEEEEPMTRQEQIEKMADEIRDLPSHQSYDGLDDYEVARFILSKLDERTVACAKIAASTKVEYYSPRDTITADGGGIQKTISENIRQAFGVGSDA